MIDPIAERDLVVKALREAAKAAEHYVSTLDDDLVRLADTTSRTESS